MTVLVGNKPRASVGMRLWSINKWLRWTGFRLFVRLDDQGPTLVGMVWYGWSFVGREPAKGRHA